MVKVKGRIDEGRQAVGDLLKRKPDLPVSGPRLMRCYIQFDGIVNRALAGLRHCGLAIA